jgi:hypothetical protein
MADEFVALVLGVTAIAGITVVLLPVTRALARRISGDAGMERRVAALEAVLADVQESDGLVRHLEDRVAKMERRRAQQSPSRGPQRPAPPGTPKVGKLWTPPPYEA